MCGTRRFRTEGMAGKMETQAERKKIGYANENFYYGFSGERTTVIRTELTLAEDVRPEMLRAALRQTLRRYPNFRQTLAVEGGRIFYAPQDGEALVGPEDGWQLYLGTAQTNGYLFRVVCDGPRLAVCAHHGLADGKGMFEFAKTLLYYYLKEQGIAADTEGMVLTNEAPGDATEQEDSFAKYADPRAKPLGLYQDGEAFRIPEPLFTQEQPYCRRFRVCCSMQALLRLARRYGATPVPVLSIVLSQALRRLYDVGEETVTGYIPVNLRPYYQSKALNNFSFAVTLPYRARLRSLDWDVQATIQRGILDLQTQRENFDYKLARMCASGEKTAQLPLPAAQKQAVLAARLRENARARYSYLLSYVGAMALPAGLRATVRDMEMFIPAFLVPFTVCAVALDDRLSLTCTQDFEGERVARALYEVLREQGIEAEYEDRGVVRADKLVLGKLAQGGV